MAHPSTGEPILRDPGRREPGKPLRSVADLVAAGLADPTRMDALEQVAARYAVAITPAMAELIDAADPDDPIGRQFVPDRGRAGRAAPSELADPIGDEAHSPVARHRAPLSRPRAAQARRMSARSIAASASAARWSGPAGRGTLSPAELDAALAYIAAQPEIWEVIVTGGDPLMLSPRRLARRDAARSAPSTMSRSCASTPACRWSIPARITDALVAALQGRGKAVYVALHANHRARADAARRAPPAPGSSTPASRCSSQTVLLSGVNDDAETLGALMRALVEMPHQALLPAPPRPRARHRAISAPASPRARR